MPGEAVEIVVPAGTAETAAPVIAAPTVQETVAAAVAVTEAVQNAAERIAAPDAELLSRINSLESQLGGANERVAFLAGAVETLTAQFQALTVAEEIEEVAEVVETPPVVEIPPESVPNPEAPEIRTKKKRRFI